MQSFTFNPTKKQTGTCTRRLWSISVFLKELGCLHSQEEKKSREYHSIFVLVGFLASWWLLRESSSSHTPASFLPVKSHWYADPEVCSPMDRAHACQRQLLTPGIFPRLLPGMFFTFMATWSLRVETVIQKENFLPSIVHILVTRALKFIVFKPKLNMKTSY